MLSLSERLERLERNARPGRPQGCGQGLCIRACRGWPTRSRQTANHSATQVSALTGNLEQLAGRLGQARADAENASPTALEVPDRQVEKALAIHREACRWTSG